MRLSEVEVGKKFTHGGRNYKRLSKDNGTCINDAGFTLNLNLSDVVVLLDVAGVVDKSVESIEPIDFYEEKCCEKPETCKEHVEDVEDVKDIKETIDNGSDSDDSSDNGGNYESN